MYFDYKPFGDTLNAEDESRIGYAAQERDEESRYFAMGARQYDPLSGRFLSVDPLFESFPDKTPYHYCNNNPISFKDPSGLSPEGEKGKEDEVQVVYYLDFSWCYEMMEKTQERMEEARVERMLFDMRSNSAFNFLTNTEINWLDNFWADGGGGAGSGGSTANYWGIRDAQVGGGRLGDIHSKIKSNVLAGKFIRSMILPTPKKWDTESIEESCEVGGAYKFLSEISCTTDFEVGFWLIFNESKNELRADFYYGIDENKFFGGEDAPIGMNLSKDEMAIGLVHSHRSGGTCFSDGDRRFIKDFTNGRFSWTNRPKLWGMTSSKEIWPIELNSKYADRTYFAVTNDVGRINSFSWKSARGFDNVAFLYYNIWCYYPNPGSALYYGSDKKSKKK